MKPAIPVSRLSGGVTPVEEAEGLPLDKALWRLSADPPKARRWYADRLLIEVNRDSGVPPTREQVGALIEAQADLEEELRRRLVSEELTVSGVPENTFQTVTPEPAWFRDARFDLDRNTITVHRSVLTAARVFQVSTAAPTGSTRQDAASETVPEARRRGPQPRRSDAVTRKMLADIESGEFTLDALKAMKQEALASLHGVSRHTVLKALDAVSEIAANSNHDNSNNTDK